MWSAVYHTLGLGDLDAETRIRRYSRALRSVRWNLWHHGRSWHARWMIPISRLASLILSHRLEADAAGQNTAKNRRPLQTVPRIPEIRLPQHRILGGLCFPSATGGAGVNCACGVDRQSIGPSAHVQEAANALVPERRSVRAQCPDRAREREVGAIHRHAETSSNETTFPRKSDPYRRLTPQLLSSLQ